LRYYPHHFNSFLTPLLSPLSLSSFSLLLIFSDGSIVLLGGTAALYLSTDQGVTFASVDLSHVAADTNGSEPFNVAMSSDGTMQFASLQNAGLMYSNDTGVTWEMYRPVYFYSNGQYTSYNQSDVQWGPIAYNGSTLYATVNGDGIFKSTSDTCALVFEAYDNFYNSTAQKWTALEVSRDEEKIVGAARYEKLYVSNDAGATWGRSGSNTLYNSLSLTFAGDTLLISTSDSSSVEIASYSDFNRTTTSTEPTSEPTSEPTEPTETSKSKPSKKKSKSGK